jgi:hypothetical protein
MMAGMGPDEARHFYEEDEDPARVFSVFDAAEKQGRLQETGPPSQRPDLVPLRELLAELVRELRQLRLLERLFRMLRGESQTKV